MQERDRFFLHNYLHYASKNHLMASIGLYECAREAVDTGAKVNKLLYDIKDDEEARKLSRDSNDAWAMRNMAVAKMFGEFVNALEDTGALWSAIRHRQRGGILKRYLRSSTAEVAQVCDDVLANETPTLRRLLNLPDLADIRHKVDADAFQRVRAFYQDYPKQMHTGANLYRMELQVSRLKPEEDDEWVKYTHVLMDVKDAGEPDPPSPTRGYFPQAFNKIKHRFTAIASVKTFSKLPPEEGRFDYMAWGTEYKSIDVLLKQTTLVTHVAMDICGFLLWLDSQGVAV